MSTEVITPKELHEALTLTLEPAAPAPASIKYAYWMTAHTSTGAYMGFHYWAAGIDPAAEDSFDQLARYLNAPPNTPRSLHVYETCLTLADYAAGDDLPASWRVRDELSILFAAWAALTTPYGNTAILILCNRAFEIDGAMASNSNIYLAAVRRFAAPTTVPEVQA